MNCFFARHFEIPSRDIYLHQQLNTSQLVQRTIWNCEYGTMDRFFVLLAFKYKDLPVLLDWE